LVNDGEVACKGIWIIPFISSSINGTVRTAVITSGVQTYSVLQSPHVDVETGPISLQQLQVNLGGQNIFSQPLNYTYEDFLQQVGPYERINDMNVSGISNGLIDQYRWENQMRFYYVNCERGDKQDFITPKTLTVSFYNATNLTIDVMYFIEIYKTMEYDIASGLVNTDILM
jgi:hypothetical protein